MRKRSDLSVLLRSIIGNNNVYYQPPESSKLQYPCIKYNLTDVQTLSADNKPYRRYKRYSVMIIDPDPDSLIPDKIGALPMSSFDRAYSADGLNHFVYTVYF